MKAFYRSIVLDLQRTEQLYPNCVDNGLMLTEENWESFTLKKKKTKEKKNVTAITHLKHNHIKEQTSITLLPHVLDIKLNGRCNRSSCQFNKQISQKRATQERGKMPFEKKKKLIRISRSYYMGITWIECQTHI